MLEAEPSLRVQLWPEVDRHAVELVAAWNQPLGVFADFPNLKLVCSLGAGVDHILADQSLDRSIPISRVIDAATKKSMVEFVLLAVLSHRRSWERVLAQAGAHQWTAPPRADRTVVCVLGCGEIGSEIATSLASLGYEVRGWSRSGRAVPGISCFMQQELNEAARGASVLINTLPLTSATRGILREELFSQLAPGAQLINVGRGAHLDLDALFAAIDSGQLAQATLDVFEQEPLPAEHRLWSYPGVLVTPHMAAQPDKKRIATQIVENYRAIQSDGVVTGLIQRRNEY